jgi:hypothetical protein
MYKYRDFGRIRLRDESADIGKGRLPASTFPDFLKKIVYQCPNESIVNIQQNMQTPLVYPKE